MGTFAAVMTGKGTGALSTIQIFGDSAKSIVERIFKPAGTKMPRFKTGEILLGTISDGGETVDQVTIGCEGPETFAINCHGNPLIVEMIMQLLQRYEAELLTAEQLLTKILSARKSISTIGVEAKLAQLKAKTIQGTKLLANQIDAGLGRKAQNWLKDINEISLDEIKAEAAQMLQKSQTAKLIIYGCTVVLTGPPNSGKSTLINYLAGRQKAIVTDIEGTTRDWIEATCQIEPLSLKLIDSAGLGENLPALQDTVERVAQRRSIQILEQADLVLLVLDNSQPAEQLDEKLPEKIADKKVIAVLNKSDLSVRFDASRLSQALSNTVQISAKEGTGIEKLTDKIRQISGATDFDLRTAVCFTDRQEDLLQQLRNTKSKQRAASIITELLKG